MKRLCLAAAVVALAPSAQAADESWLISGGEGSALGYDKTSVVKAEDKITLRHGVYSAVAFAPPASVSAAPVVGLIGQIVLDCPARTLKRGDTLWLFADGKQKLQAKAEDAAFAPVSASDPRAYFFAALCDGKSALDLYPAVGRDKALATLKRVAGQKRVTASAKKGWALALADSARLVAIDTGSSKRDGETVSQTELTWMRQPQTYKDQTWRYNQMTVEYDCAQGARRGAGTMQVYGPDDKLVHEEVLEDAPWTKLPAAGPGRALLQIACKDAKLAGLPAGARAAMISRLKELASLK